MHDGASVARERGRRKAWRGEGWPVVWDGMLEVRLPGHREGQGPLQGRLENESRGRSVTASWGQPHQGSWQRKGQRDPEGAWRWGGGGAETREHQFKEEGEVNSSISVVRGAAEQGLSGVPGDLEPRKSLVT